jgi:hypothetical protein
MSFEKQKKGYEVVNETQSKLEFTNIKQLKK